MQLVFHQAALGDWVLVMPILRALAARGPVTAVTADQKAKLAAAMIGGVEACDIEQRQLTMLHVEGGFAALGERWRKRLGAATRIVSFVSRGGDWWAKNIRRAAARAELAFVQPRPGPTWRGHVCDWHRRQLGEQGIELDEPAVERSANPHRPIVIHPGSGGADKCWPIEHFETLIESLRDRGDAVKVIYGEVEAERWPGETLQRLDERYGARRVSDLIELYEVVRSARLVIGNDAGPAHVAGASGIPTLALFGPTDPRRWSPRGPAGTTLSPARPAPMAWLEPKMVLAVCQGLVTH